MWECNVADEDVQPRLIIIIIFLFPAGLVGCEDFSGPLRVQGLRPSAPSAPFWPRACRAKEVLFVRWFY
jgi:hypothetical protein